MKIGEASLVLKVDTIELIKELEEDIFQIVIGCLKEFGVGVNYGFEEVAEEVREQIGLREIWHKEKQDARQDAKQEGEG